MQLRAPQQTVGLIAALVGLAFAMSACGDDEPKSAPASGSTSPTESAFVMVVLGDSDSTAAGDEDGTGWAGRYADLLEDKLKRPVDMRSHASEGQTTDELLSLLADDEGLHDDIAAADLVVIGTGGADVNIGDEAYLSGSCKPRECYAKVLGEFAANIEAIMGKVAELRADEPVALRAITLPHVVPGAEDVIPAEVLPIAKGQGLFAATSQRDSTCKAVRTHGGECIDVLTAFNGPDGTQNAYETGLLNHDDCCYPSAEGHQRIAELLLETGTEPRALR